MNQSNTVCRIRPDADCCFGREALAQALIATAVQTQTVLLFGGRQSGKTTLLKFTEYLTQRKVRARAEFDEAVIAVYVDLLMLPYESGPSEFYQLLSNAARQSCTQHLVGFASCEPAKDAGSLPMTVDLFLQDLEALQSAAGCGRLRFVFLLDEAKRVLGSRFPRGFQDNLFSLLYGGSAKQGEAISFVFAGAQELYALSEDDTSPLSSRAAIQLVTNLTYEDLIPLVGFASPESNISQRDALASSIFARTGGHAGLSARFAEVAMDSNDLSGDRLGSLSDQLGLKIVQLFRHWNLHLTKETRKSLLLLINKDGLLRRDLGNFLEEQGLDRLASDRVWEELQYVGIAKAQTGLLLKANPMYWDYIREFGQLDRPLGLDSEVWTIIEELETALRTFIKDKFATRWANPYDQMKKVLGPEWDKLQLIKVKSENYYPYARDKTARDVMECMYLGQMGNLILSNECWSLFKDIFRDKRHFQDLLAAISPVRNDRAHFCDVPQKELNRCKIACDDLLVIIEKSSVGIGQTL